MGSLDDETLVQMVHDFIESEPSQTAFPASRNSLHLSYQAKFFTLQEILGTVTEAEAKVRESSLKHMRSKKDAYQNTTNNLKKWLVMELKMDGFCASICKTSWVTSLGCPGGDYEYIQIMLKDENGNNTRLIADIDFRSQFELARPTPSYKQLTDTLPSFFVGNEDKLKKIISLLCSAARHSLRESGLHVPPWRTITYMQCKWLSTVDYKNRENSGRQGSGTGANGNLSIWTPPMVKPKRRDHLAGGSALASEFSGMGINCC